MSIANIMITPRNAVAPGSGEGESSTFGDPTPATDGILAHRCILVVEDESLIALLIADALEDAGATVVGPCYTLDECLRAARDERIDAAVLDVNLAGEDVFPAADELRRRGIPFLFHTAHGEREELRARFGDITVCRKPADMAVIVASVERIAGDDPTN